eukprot:1159266-Pelagomonas_calceolata.AAC.3
MQGREGRSRRRRKRRNRGASYINCACPPTQFLFQNTSVPNISNFEIQSALIPSGYPLFKIQGFLQQRRTNLISTHQDRCSSSIA